MQNALTGSRSIHVSAKGVVIGTVALVVGFLQLVLGPLVLPILHPRPGESKALAYLSGAVIAAMGFGAYFALKSYLASRGYVFP